MEKCKNNTNVLQTILYDIKKNNCSRKSLYLQVLMICCKTEVEEGKKISKYKDMYSFQGKSEKSKNWFDLDLDWI